MGKWIHLRSESVWSWTALYRSICSHDLSHPLLGHSAEGNLDSTGTPHCVTRKTQTLHAPSPGEMSVKGKQIAPAGLGPLETTLRQLGFHSHICCFKSRITLKFNLVSAPNLWFRCGLGKSDNNYALSLTLSQISCKLVWYEKNIYICMYSGNLIPNQLSGWQLNCSIVSQGMLSATTLMQSKRGCDMKF